MVGQQFKKGRFLFFTHQQFFMASSLRRTVQLRVFMAASCYEGLWSANSVLKKFEK